MRLFLQAWLAVLCWMSVIFVASTDIGSSAHTSMIIVPVLHWIKPDISDEAVQKVQLVVRKTAHVTEYAIFGLLTFRALRMTKGLDRWAWSARLAGITLLIAAVYASLDEFHQLFVPSRGSSPVDVGIDTIGAAVGLALLCLVSAWRRKAGAYRVVTTG